VRRWGAGLGLLQGERVGMLPKWWWEREGLLPLENWT
jgi:hypothetical protein